ncbi:MAG: chitobiase/beta-hexosaminidase C-terminal domain-containing protein [Verrucomicrobiales bacterium]
MPLPCTRRGGCWPLPRSHGASTRRTTAAPPGDRRVPSHSVRPAPNTRACRKAGVRSRSVSGLGNVAATPEAQAFMREKNMKDAGELMTYFAVQVNEMVKKRGRKTILWEGAANGAAKDMVHMTWDGGARTAERLVSQGITTITVPWNLAGVPWQNWTMYHSNGSELKEGDPVLGAMLPVWEQKGEVNLRWLRGGLAARQERTWGPDTLIEPANFEGRAASCDLVLDRMLYGFAIVHNPRIPEGFTHRQITTQAMLSFPTWGAYGAVRFTTDDTEPTAQSPEFTTAIPLADSITIKARLFDKKGNPAGQTWTQPYIFTPLTLQAQGILPEGTWFADTATVVVASTMKAGMVRYTLDGSAPLPTSPAYAKPLTIIATTTIKARWFDAQNVGRGEIATATYQKLVTMSHAAVNKPVTMTVTAKLTDPAQNAKLLVDGVLTRGGAWGAPEVLRLGDSDLHVIIDMGANTEVRKVVVQCIYCQEAGIYPAKHIEVSVSHDGQNFTIAGAADFKVPDERGADGSSIREIAVESNGAGRYVKIFCTNNGQLPAWHNSPGVLGHLMLDEILVNPIEAPR